MLKRRVPGSNPGSQSGGLEYPVVTLMPDQNLTAHTITGTDHGLLSVDIATPVSDTRANATWKAFVAANDSGIGGGLRETRT